MTESNLQVKQWKIDDLIGAEYNPRKLSDEQKQTIKDSIKRFGLVDPVLVNTNTERKGIIIGGHQRTMIARELGYKQMPCIELDLTFEKEKELNVRLNKNTGEFDFDLLSEHFKESELISWGFDEDELEFFDGDETLEAEEDDFEIPEEIKTDIALGDLFEIGEHRLLCGDSTDSDQVAKLMDGEFADMVHTDPPYNIGYEGGSKKREKIANDKLDDFPKFLYDAYTTLTTALKKGGAVYVWHASSETHNFIQQFINAGFLFKSYIVWNKNNSTFGRSDYHWKHEPCIYGWLDGASHKWCGDRKQTTVWDLDRPSRSDEHPTMKPIPLCSKPLENSSKIGDIVLDTFLGSGSTMVASHQLKRRCYGMELDPKYCQVIIDRMRKLDPDLIVKRNGKEI